MWLKRKLEFSNEPSLYERLQDLLSVSPGSVRSVVTPHEPFIRKVVDSRNYRVHFSERLAGRAAVGAELEWLTEALVMLIESRLLLEIGLPEPCTADVRGRASALTFLYDTVRTDDVGHARAMMASYASSPQRSAPWCSTALFADAGAPRPQHPGSEVPPEAVLRFPVR